MPLDIVIPYKRNNCGELETCLKLLEKNFPHRNIHVVDSHDHPQYHFPPHVDQILKYKWAIGNLDLTDKFYAFNDDFFIMKPVSGTPYYHKGLLSEHIDSRPRRDWYTRSLINTQWYLNNDALSYELHVPFLFDKHKLYALIEVLDPANNKDCPLIRSAYGNAFNVSGEYMEDVKNVRNFTDKPYLSTTEGSFLRQPIGTYIRSRT